MRQLLLDWGADKPQTLDNFVAGRNRELTQLLDDIGRHGAGTLDQRFIYLWGESGAGKTHLLKAMAALRPARYLAAGAPAADYEFTPEVGLYLLDDCERLSPETQIAAFALYNQARDCGAALIAAGAAPPAGLAVREDLRTRLGWGLVYHLQGLSDEEKTAALTQAAQARGLALSASVIPYLITHYRRDMPSLSAMLEALDRYSLERQRPITLPLLRELLQLQAETQNATKNDDTTNRP